MFSTRSSSVFLSLALIVLQLTACRSPNENDKAVPPPKAAPKQVEIQGVNTNEFTPREKSEFSALVSELLAPCNETPVSIYECVETKKSCSACLPAAQYISARVREGMTKGQVEAAYKGRFDQASVVQIPVEGSPIKGAKDAPITVIEWADFECPVCRVMAPVLKKSLADEKDVRFIFKNFPLAMHENAEIAARASAAAQVQGKFWEMYEMLFSVEPPLTESKIKTMAETIGLDIAQFKKDLRSEAVADAVARDRKQGEAVNLSGTPTIYINGRRFVYSADVETEFKEWFALERTLLKQKN